MAPNRLMAEAETQLYAETQSETGIYTAVKTSPFGVLTSLGRNVKVFQVPSGAGPLLAGVAMSLPGTIYHYEWHPCESAYLVLLKDFPVYLVQEGKVLKTFPVLNHLDEVKSPLAACFDYSDSSYFYTGLGNRLFRYSLNSSSVTCYSLDLPTLKVRPKTLISALDSTSNIVSVGTYSKLVYLFSLSEGHPIAVLEGQSGGLIQCAFQGCNLYTGGRNDDTVYCWDLRVLSQPMQSFSYYRSQKSQQRVLFSVSQTEIRIGNDDGSVFLYSTKTGMLESYFMAHFDAVNSVQALGDFVISSSGQRHFSQFDEGVPAPNSSIRVWTGLKPKYDF